MVTFKTKAVKTLFTNIKIGGAYVGVSFNNYMVRVHDPKVIEAMREDPRNGNLWYEVWCEADKRTDDKIVDLPITDNSDDKEVVTFRTVIEAKEWLKQKYNAPSAAIETSKKCIEYAESKGIIIKFEK